MDQESHEPYEDKGSRTVKEQDHRLNHLLSQDHPQFLDHLLTETGSFRMSGLSTVLGLVLWIRDILVRILIRGSIPLTYGSESGSWLFRG
jgi:hypothetical protein